MSPQPQKPNVPAERAPAKPTLSNVKGGLNTWLAHQRVEIAKALPRMLDPDQFIRIALTTVKQDEYLMEADPISFITAVFEAAQAGLQIDGTLGHAYLVSFWSSKRGTRLVQLIPGYKGLMELARRSGEIAKIEARVVRPGDHFSYAYGIHQRLDHTPADLEDASLEQWSHVYAIAWFKDTATPPQFEVMTYRAVMAIKARSAAAQRGKSPWDTDEIPMAQKTVIRRLMRLLPLAVNDQRIVEKDEAFDAGVRTAEFELKSSAPAGVEDLSSPAEPAGEPVGDALDEMGGEPREERAPAPEAAGEPEKDWDYETQGDPPPEEPRQVPRGLLPREPRQGAR